jgi:hypothetical protein
MRVREGVTGAIRGAMIAPMDVNSFRSSLSDAQPPAGLSLALQALWWDAKGGWDRSHELAQQREDAAGNRVHAYLHRKEGDQGNAGYWYRRCRIAPFSGSLEQEWEALVEQFLRDDL